MIVRSADDIEVEAGEVAVGEIRARAFAELVNALEGAQLLSLVWLEIADLAVWPQLPVPEAVALTRVLETGGSFRPALPADPQATPSVVALQAIAPLLALIDQLNRGSTGPLAPSAVDLSSLRLVVNRLARASRQPISYWEKWLRRVVPSAVTLPAGRAMSLAIAALRTTFAAPDRWEYVATVDSIPDVPEAPRGVRVCAVSPGRGGREFVQLGVFTGQGPIQRVISATFTPQISVDPCRMGYLFHSAYMTDLLDDARTGYYDRVTCTNSVTGESWSYTRY